MLTPAKRDVSQPVSSSSAKRQSTASPLEFNGHSLGTPSAPPSHPPSVLSPPGAHPSPLSPTCLISGQRPPTNSQPNALSSPLTSQGEATTSSPKDSNLSHGYAGSHGSQPQVSSSPPSNQGNPTASSPTKHSSLGYGSAASQGSQPHVFSSPPTSQREATTSSPTKHNSLGHGSAGSHGSQPHVFSSPPTSQREATTSSPTKHNSLGHGSAASQGSPAASQRDKKPQGPSSMVGSTKGSPLHKQQAGTQSVSSPTAGNSPRPPLSGGRRGPASPAGTPSPRQQARAPAPPSPHHIFHGLRFFSFVPQMQKLFEKVRERGGGVDKQLDAHRTTHVIARHDISLSRLKDKLASQGITLPEPTPCDTSATKPPGTSFHIITQDFVGRSILAGKREDEAPYAVQGMKAYQQACRELLHQQLEAATTAAAEPASPVAEAGPSGGRLAELPSKASGRSAPKRYVLPKPEEICSNPSTDWGVHGRWIEPFDEAAALRTIWLLRRRWTRKDRFDVMREASQLKAQLIAAAEAAAAPTPAPPETALPSTGPYAASVREAAATGTEPAAAAAAGAGGGAETEPPAGKPTDTVPPAAVPHPLQPSLPQYPTPPPPPRAKPHPTQPSVPPITFRPNSNHGTRGRQAASRCFYTPSCLPHNYSEPGKLGGWVDELQAPYIGEPIQALGKRPIGAQDDHKGTPPKQQHQEQQLDQGKKQQQHDSGHQGQEQTQQQQQQQEQQQDQGQQQQPSQQEQQYQARQLQLQQEQQQDQGHQQQQPSQQEQQYQQQPSQQQPSQQEQWYQKLLEQQQQQQQQQQHQQPSQQQQHQEQQQQQYQQRSQQQQFQEQQQQQQQQQQQYQEHQLQLQQQLERRTSRYKPNGPPPRSDAEIKAAQQQRQQLLQELEEEGGVVNDACEHVCCQARPFCIIQQLQETYDLYTKSIDPRNFRRKHALHAIQQLQGVEEPITCEDDLKELGLTGKTYDKVVEILQTGRLRRNEEWKGDKTYTTGRMFESIWGVGREVARQWIQAGCFSIDDVRRRVQEYDAQVSRGEVPDLPECFKLTSQQEMGLRFAEDIAKRVHRSKIAPVEQVIKQVAVQAIHELTGLSPEVIQDDSRPMGLHVRALGSYARGAPTSSDVDIIISAPEFVSNPQAVAEQGGRCTLNSPGALMRRVLDHLFASGCLAGGMRDRIDSCEYQPLDSVTFLGIWSRDGPVKTEHYFRIDIKVYPRCQLPFALIYFQSGQSFNRAIRFWCNAPRPFLKHYVRQEFSPRATGFHCTDQVLCPEERFKSNHRQVLGGCLSCLSETDIFKYIGLAYVPPSMRVLV